MSRGAIRFTRLLAVVVTLGLLLRVFVVLSSPLAELGGPVEDWFLLDDSYYCFSIARNMQRGEGWTHDGVNQTNGFQPLFVLAISPLFAAFEGDDERAIRAALILLALANAGAGLLLSPLLAGWGAGPWARLAAVGLWAFSPNVIGLGVNGMESSIALLFVALALVVYGRLRAQLRPRRVVALGLILGIGLWARLDVALLAVALGLDIASRLWGGDGRVRDRARRVLATMGLLALVTVGAYAPWMLWSAHQTGNLLPESGPAVRQLSLVRAVGRPERLPDYMADNVGKALAWSLLENPVLPNTRMLAHPSGRFERSEDLAFPVKGALVALLALALWRAGRRERLAQLAEHGRPALLYALLMVIAYSVYVFGDHYFYRYLYPLLWLSVALACALVASLSARVRAVFVVAGALAFAVNLTVEIGALASPAPGAHWGASQVALKNRLPLRPGEAVGAFQSGYASFVDDDREHPFVNLDGVVNGAAYEAIRERRLVSYLQERGIRFVVDWPNLRPMLFHSGVHPSALRVVDQEGGVVAIEVIGAPGAGAD